MAPSLSPDVFCSASYDYLVVGGGTAGLVLAARLSEIPSMTVGVIEAGGDQTEDLNVLTPGLATSMLGNSTYDWGYQTTPQVDADNRTVYWPRGRQLGGSSAVNFMFFTHASVADIDDWGHLGNEGWSWKDLLPYFMKSETFVPPTPKTAEDLNIDFLDPSVHGESGPIRNGFSQSYNAFDLAWSETFEKLGLAPTGDPKAGVTLGGYGTTTIVDPVNATRQFAGNCYLNPVSKRDNLKVITNALVEKILFSDKRQDQDPLVATGVQFRVKDKSYTVNAKREVVLAAGSINSPQILELSGVGSADLLKSQGLDVLIDNPNVGENLQDHMLVPMGFQAAEGVATSAAFADPAVLKAAMQDYTENRRGPFASIGSSTAMLSYKQTLLENATATSPKGVDSVLDFGGVEARPGLLEQYRLTLAKLLNEGEAAGQILSLPTGLNPGKGDSAQGYFTPDTPGSYYTLVTCLTHPFSRGSVHITSTDPAVYPSIDPRYLSHPLDVEVFAATTLHLQTVAQTEPMASLLKDGGKAYQPEYSQLTEDNVRAHVKAAVNTEYHPIGTCSMEPRDKGGVVDARLRLYGAKNVRVVDASVFPIHIRGNPVSLVYAVAEKAADMIKEDAKGYETL
ncbi:MAG: hypothetical protein M1833_005028 [Piccolia ochrophora]|nr:MAG: hypothetical protein M1833_005028 [Piccolia ochrophora]